MLLQRENLHCINSNLTCIWGICFFLIYAFSSMLGRARFGWVGSTYSCLSLMGWVGLGYRKCLCSTHTVLNSVDCAVVMTKLLPECTRLI